MRQNLSRGMVVASAATSILSLYVIPAFASSYTEAVPAGPVGGPSGHALPDVPVDHAEGSCAESLRSSAEPAASTGKSCDTSPNSRTVRGAEHGESRPRGARGNRTAHAGAAGYGDDDTADGVPVRADGSGTAASAPAPSRGGGLEGGLPGHGDGNGLDGGFLGHGDDSGLDGGFLGHGDGNGLDGGFLGHGDDSASSGVHVHGTDVGYGDTPPTTPPTTPPVSPPTKTPPTKTPPAKTPPATQPATPPSTPASPPAQPPSLPNTGAGDLTFMATGVAALLTTGGVVLYRRGRTATRG
ncbi:LPXTG cell wall anchor domain-containing protein [Streptomyces flaveolus]|uniref:LPXTG cell wall anchor domain-containing protein n=1 Tax=Streptomyces flaveolus TaxID=67297 RepID=UPI0033B1379F